MTTYEQRRDRREKAPFAQKSGRTDLITRQEAADIMGMSLRSVTRFATLGYLTKFRDARGQIRFAPEQVRAMGYFEAEPKPGRPGKESRDKPIRPEGYSQKARKNECGKFHPSDDVTRWCTLDEDHSSDHWDGTDSWPPG